MRAERADDDRKGTRATPTCRVSTLVRLLAGRRRNPSKTACSYTTEDTKPNAAAVERYIGYVEPCRQGNGRTTTHVSHRADGRRRRRPCPKDGWQQYLPTGICKSNRIDTRGVRREGPPRAPVDSTRVPVWSPDSNVRLSNATSRHLRNAG